MQSNLGLLWEWKDHQRAIQRAKKLSNNAHETNIFRQKYPQKV